MTIKDGKVVNDNVTIGGTKVFLVEIRRKLLKKSNLIENLIKHDLIIMLKQVNKFTSTEQFVN